MTQEGHIITLPEPVCGSERWAILRLVTHDRARGSSLYYATLACDLDGERRVIDLGEETGWLTRSRRGEVLSNLHSAERHAIIVALEQLLGELGLDVVRTKIKGADKPLAERKPSASGLAPWEELERLESWALGVDGLRVTHTAPASLSRAITLHGVHIAWCDSASGAWLLGLGYPLGEAPRGALLDRVIEIVRSAQDRIRVPEA